MNQVVTLLGLNWELFIAQLVNFAIVLFVLWKWVFTPLGKKLTERSEKIEKSIAQQADIEAQHAAAAKFRKEEMAKAQAEAAAVIDRAQVTAKKTGEQIVADARKASEQLVAQTKVQLEDEKAKLIREVKEYAATLVTMATEKIIREKLDSAKDQELIKETLKTL